MQTSNKEWKRNILREHVWKEIILMNVVLTYYEGIEWYMENNNPIQSIRNKSSYL